MRRLPVGLVRDAVRRGFVEANRRLPRCTKSWLAEAERRETSAQARRVLGMIRENSRVAERTGLPLCQDTGLAVILLEVGQEVLLTGGDLRRAVDEAVREAVREGHLRASVVSDPLRRSNTFDNTPAVLHTEMVPGDRVRVTVLPKGGGAENMSFLRMLTPSADREEVERVIAEGVVAAGTSPCPPVVVGVGLGGNFELCAWLAKKALLRERPHRDPFYAAMEESIRRRIDASRLGPQNPAGGRTTALAVRIEVAACHIASLPVAVNINCHSHRWWRCVL